MESTAVGGSHGWSSKERIGLVLGPVLFVVILMLPQPQNMVEAAYGNAQPPFAPKLALGTMVWMIVWWVTECIPLGITGLLAPFIFSLAGILSIREAVLSFADPIIWIFISGFILAAAFQRVGLDRRIAYSLALIYKGTNPKIAAFFVVCLPVFLLTMTGSITGSTTIVFPFVIAFLGILGISNPSATRDATAEKYEKNGKKSNYAEASFLALGQAATAGAMLLLISTAPNLIAKATVEQFVPGETVAFVDWFVIGTPHAIFGLVVSWIVIFSLIRPEIKTLPATRLQLKSHLISMGRMKREEKAVLSILIAAIFLWVVPSVLRSTLGSGQGYDQLGLFAPLIRGIALNVTEAIPAIMIILAVAIVRTRKGGGPLLKWDQMAKAVDWNIVMLFGGGLVLGMGMVSSGLADWIGLQITSSIGQEITPWVIFAASAIMGFAVSYAASNTASAVITCPIAATLAIGVGLDPIPPIIAAGLACSISSAIPSTTPPMAIIYSSRAVRISSMFKTGMISDIIRLTALIVVGPVLVDLVL